MCISPHHLKSGWRSGRGGRPEQTLGRINMSSCRCGNGMPCRLSDDLDRWMDGWTSYLRTYCEVSPTPDIFDVVTMPWWEDLCGSPARTGLLPFLKDIKL